jgi:hypothetical protein
MPTDDLMTFISRWLHRRNDIEALRLACNAVLHMGQRRHIELLKAAEGGQSEFAAAMICNMEFDVKRRTLTN